ncbi:MAG: Rpp14/Pop5 family protein [Sulfolobales archaeon]
MEYELLISLISLMLTITLAIYVYRVERRLGLITEAIKSKSIMKVVNTLKMGKRLRKRYMIFEVISEKEINSGLLEYEIRASFRRLFGELHLARAALALQYFNSKSSIGVIKHSHIYRYKLLASLGVVRKVGDFKVMIIPLRITGTLKKALEYVKVKEGSIKK